MAVYYGVTDNKGYRLRYEIGTVTQKISSNQFSVPWALYLESDATYFVDHRSTFSTVLDGVTVYSTNTTYVSLPTPVNNYTQVLLASGTNSVSYTAGATTKTLNVSASFRVNTVATYTPQGTLTVTGSLVLTIIPRATNGEYYFNTWTDSYTYLEYTTALNSNGSYTVSISQKMYNNLALNSAAATLYCIADGIQSPTQTASLSIAAGSNTQIASYTITIPPGVVRQKTISIVTYATIAGPGTSNAVASATLQLIPLPTIGAIVISQTANTPASTTSTAVVSCTMSGNSYSFYRFKLTYSKNSAYLGGTIIPQGSYGLASDSRTLTGLDPYVTYYYKYTIEGKDGIVYATAADDAATLDIYPSIQEFKNAIADTTQLTVSFSAYSRSAMLYTYRKYVNNAWTTVSTNNPATIYNYTGLTSNTAYALSGIVTNASGYSATSNTINITTPTGAPTLTTIMFNIGSTEITINVDASVNTATYSFSKDNGTTWTAPQASSSYTFAGLAPSYTYYFRVRLFDATTPTPISTTTTTYTRTTLATAPIISAVTLMNITGSTVTVKVTGTAGAGIRGYKFSVVEHGQPALYSTERTSSTFIKSGLTPQTAYDVQVQLLDSSNPVQTATSVLQEFSTVTGSPAASLARTKFVRNISTNLAQVPLIDGTLLITTDDGHIYFDVDNGSNVDRRLISTGVKVYVPTYAAGTYTVSTNDFNGIDTSKLVVSFYLIPSDTSSATPSLNFGEIGLQPIYQLDGATQTILTAGRVYLIAFNATANKFIIVNS